MSVDYESNAIPPLNVHIVSSDLKGEKRDKEYRTSHKTWVLNAANPYLQIAGYDPARCELYLNVLENAVVITSSAGAASDLNNTTGTLATPNGRVVPSSNGSEYCVKGQNEIWISAATYPTRVGVSVVREI
jgi:hypothetical protein